MVTASELLTLVNAVIEARLNGDAYREYVEAGDRFTGESLESLMRTRTQLQAEVAAESGKQFSLAELRED